MGVSFSHISFVPFAFLVGIELMLSVAASLVLLGYGRTPDVDGDVGGGTDGSAGDGEEGRVRALGSAGTQEAAVGIRTTPEDICSTFKTMFCSPVGMELGVGDWRHLFKALTRLVSEQSGSARRRWVNRAGLQAAMSAPHSQSNYSAETANDHYALSAGGRSCSSTLSGRSSLPGNPSPRPSPIREHGHSEKITGSNQQYMQEDIREEERARDNKNGSLQRLTPGRRRKKTKTYFGDQALRRENRAKYQEDKERKKAAKERKREGSRRAQEGPKRKARESEVRGAEMAAKKQRRVEHERRRIRRVGKKTVGPAMPGDPSDV